MFEKEAEEYGLQQALWYHCITVRVGEGEV